MHGSCHAAGFISTFPRWLDALRGRKGEDGEPYANAKQFEAMERVGRRVMQELVLAASPDADVAVDLTEPLRWLVHGGPGTGKTHVIALVKELFTDVLGWNIAVEFQVVSLQAVTACMLGGDTIHHACGIPVFKKDGGADGEGRAQSHMDTAKRVLRWRWLIIDEISMVSAKLFAQMDMKLREVVRHIGTTKVDSDGRDRPFGGLNVLC
jgi:hypothetical protein